MLRTKRDTRLNRSAEYETTARERTATWGEQKRPKTTPERRGRAGVRTNSAMSDYLRYAAERMPTTLDRRCQLPNVPCWVPVILASNKVDALSTQASSLLALLPPSPSPMNSRTNPHSSSRMLNARIRTRRRNGSYAQAGSESNVGMSCNLSRIPPSALTVSQTAKRWKRIFATT